MKHRVGLSQRKYTINLILFFWIVSICYLITQGLLKYLIILEIWGSNNTLSFLYNFAIYNFPIMFISGLIHSIIIYLLLDTPEKLMYELKEQTDRKNNNTAALFNCLYQKQRILSLVFLSSALFFSIGTMVNWIYSPFMVSASYWLTRIITFSVYFSLGFAAYRLFNLSVVRFTGNIVSKYKIFLMGNRKPLNMTYNPLIITLSMIIFCISLVIYIDIMAKIEHDLQIRSFLNISSTLNTQKIPLDNFLIIDIMKREISQQAIMLVGVDPYIGLDEGRSLAVFRGRGTKGLGFYVLMAYIVFIFIMYFQRSNYLITRMLNHLSEYLRGVLQGTTSLKQSVPLLRFDALGYMTGYLNLLFKHVYKIIINLVNSVAELMGSSENSIGNSTSGTNEVYNITHSFSSINLKADLQLQSIRTIREAFNDSQEIIQFIDQEVSIQKKQLENAKNTVSGVKTAIQEMEQSSKNVAKMFEQLNQSADDGLDVVKNAYSVMAEISHTSYSVRDIVSSIEKISGQIGLLAMSASIESAHAGNHGLGFSVVAQSVRNLSDDSGTQSKAIRLQIEEMVQKVEVGVLLSRHVSRSFQSIANSTKTSANLFHQIYSSVEEQNKQSATIGREIDELLATTEEILNFTHEQVEVLNQLTQTTKTLELEIKTISDTSQHQSSMSEEVISLFENLNNQIILNIERVHSINEKINRFKLD